MVLDMNEPNNVMKHTYGFNKVYGENSSIGIFVSKDKKELSSLYVAENLKTIEDDNFIKDLFREHPDHFRGLGVSENEVIEEMKKFREMIENTKEVARDKAKNASNVEDAKKFIAPDGTPTLQDPMVC